LRVTIPAAAQAAGGSRQLLVLAALAVALAVTLFSGFLLARDVRRELRLSELRAQFVASVSHELKTPLTAIRMYTEAMQLEEDLERQVRIQYLDTIAQETGRLSRLVDNILDFARIEQGRKTYRMASVLLADVVEDAARTIAYPMSQSGFRLSMDMDRDMAPISGDRDALEQAVINLLSNAVKYSGEAREIGLKLARDDGDAVITVRDEGIGIPAHEQARIFEQFYRVPSPENDRLPGTGLGLTLVDHIVKAHGGRVTVESQPGRGSLFTIRLPLGRQS
jgi:signal transduction histidine kinase